MTVTRPAARGARLEIKTTRGRVANWAAQLLKCHRITRHGAWAGTLCARQQRRSRDHEFMMLSDFCPVRLAYQPPASSTFFSEQTSHQQPASSTFLSEQISTSHQPPATSQTNRLFFTQHTEPD
jgi:hypothetical protein